jgi:Uri superfamily endonuclease
MVRQKVSDRIRKALKAGYGNKSKSCFHYIGCSVPHLRQHLEAQFTDGMTWDNHGEWHIDHIKPCASFDLTDAEQQRECFNYTNLQPLWAVDNLTKGAKYNET